ncbi:MAG: FtsX-like permease family protein [Clostridia bacterium]|nr:FtsX-like permease family protein [Clostridia bacterium]
MKFARTIAKNNFKKKPLRTLALILLVAFLSFTAFGGSLVILSLKNGLDSYEARLGADVVVVPYQARTQGTFESIILQGIPGYFYMDKSHLDKVRAVDGVAIASPQFYLATVSAGCCSVPVQIIGFDPETDFTIQPWIKKSYTGSIGEYDIIIGADVNMPVDGKLTFYDKECRVVAQLDKTGTGLDTTVYCNMDTAKDLERSAEELGFSYLGDVPLDRAISSVFVKVKQGYDVDYVTDRINIEVRHVKAGGAKSMVSGVADGLTSVSNVIGVLIAVVWVLCVVILIVAFTMITGERKKEFAILRILGASRLKLSLIVGTEAALIGGIGSLVGLGLSLLVVLPLGASLRTALSLPYLLPSVGVIVGLALGALVVSAVVGSMTSLFAAKKIAGTESGLLIREDA